LRAIVAKASLPTSWTKLWLKKLGKEETEEKINSETAIVRLSSEIQEIDQKLDKLLEGYLDQIVDPQIYQRKKNELVETKIKLKEKMGSISKNGNEWLRLMREFIQVAALAAKIARAKNNPDELCSIGKKVGSDYSLNNRQLSCRYETGFSALAARTTAACAASYSPFLWTLYEKIRTEFRR